MKHTKKKKRIWGYFLLAALCVGIMELLFCSWFSPALFARITAPVANAAQAIGDTVMEAVQAAQAQIQAWQTGHFVRSRCAASAKAAISPFPLEFSPPQVAIEPAPTPDAPPADPVVTQLIIKDGQEVLTGGAMPCVYFNQRDPAWANMPYGDDPIGPYGCGPTAMAMVVASMTGADTDPGKMAAWAAANGYWAPQSGSYQSIIQDTAQAFGLQCDRLTACTPDQLLQCLLSDKLMVGLVGPGHFTNSGHFIVLRGATLTGQVLVADPNSRQNSLVAWDPQVLLEETSSSDGKGLWLWLISTPPPSL